MIINGVYAQARAHLSKNNSIDDYAVSQIKMLCDNEISSGNKICIMPDVHPGKVGTIGLTMTIGNKVMPMLNGVDIGCGMTLAKFKCKKIEYEKLDRMIREQIPSGSAYRKKQHHFCDELDLTRLKCFKHIRLQSAYNGIGTLGGGNHFIEVDTDNDGDKYLVIHSGSRHLGKEVMDYYMSEGQKYLQKKGIRIPYELTYLEGELLEQYLLDMKTVTEYADLNRQAMLFDICKGMKWKVTDNYSCIHNYISEDMILRKGAISAKAGESVIIPINMRDGIILGTGLGNKDWNYSAPHGAGRIIKREEVKSKHTVSEFKKSMKGIYSSCVNSNTLDEAPFAYRNLEDIVSVIGDTVAVDRVIRPVYNYKDSGKGMKV